jgi:hypothetical protein
MAFLYWLAFEPFKRDGFHLSDYELEPIRKPRTGVSPQFHFCIAFWHWRQPLIPTDLCAGVRGSMAFIPVALLFAANLLTAAGTQPPLSVAAQSPNALS